MQSIITTCPRAGTSGGLGLAVLVVTAIACQAGGISDKEIVVGTHLDLSGPVSAAMPQLRNGTQMRFAPSDMRWQWRSGRNSSTRPSAARNALKPSNIAWP